MTRNHRLGPITRTVIAQRRAGTLDKAADDPLVYLVLLRAAVEADRQMALSKAGFPRPRPGNLTEQEIP